MRCMVLGPVLLLTRHPQTVRGPPGRPTHSAPGPVTGAPSTHPARRAWCALGSRQQPPSRARRWREAYQRLHPAQYILDKYAGRRYVVLVCDSDEVPRREVVADLRGPLYGRTADALYLEMRFLYYNFRCQTKPRCRRSAARHDVPKLHVARAPCHAK